MKSLEEIQERWRATQTHSASLAELQRVVKYNTSSSPCLSGFRSLCWKTFLLSKDKRVPEPDWIQILQDGRHTYNEQRERLLKYIKHPEALAELSVDPLADDPNSPWDAARQDEIVRQEIQQDVQRLPDEADYHDSRIQLMILDILFVYCKNNPTRGGYRQGMHELLAPIVHVLEQDAIDRAALGESHSLDTMMLELLDSSYIEHDAYILFARVMDNAQSFYAVNEPSGKPGSAAPGSRGQTSTIVERSKFIHEVCLNKVDPELALHLTNIEILPQIFLIRWVRLLFSREFPFEQSLILWDTMFAVDPNLELIDLVCVAMLIRIRWQLLEADYSNCLQLLLKYPPPSQQHGPHTFVDDAVYLRSHLNAPGGATLTMKYTGKMPTVSKSPDGSRPSTPSFRGFNAFRQKNLAGRSPLTSPVRFGNQQGGVEALFQGAAKGAKGVFERGEKLGINQAVRDAMGEIRRNMQAFNDARQSQPQDILGDDGLAATALAAMQERNRQLSAMLEETVTSLKDMSATNLEDKSKSLDLIEVAAAKIQFVKIYLEDPTMELPDMGGIAADEGRMDTDETAESTAAGKLPEAKADPVLPNVKSLTLSDAGTPTTSSSRVDATLSPTSSLAMDTSGGDDTVAADPLKVASSPPVATRPAAIPTRSTLAQSSFSWMLEPNEPASTHKSAPNSRSPPPSGHKKRPSNNVSREKNAFLFGEIANEGDGKDPLDSKDIFGMQPLRKEK